VQPPEGTRFHFSPVERWHLELCHSVKTAENWSDGLVEGESYRRLVENSCRALELDVECTAMESLLSVAYNRELSTSDRWDLLWRMAAGREYMAAGKSLNPGFQDNEGEWLPLSIERIRYAMPSSKGRMRLAVKFRIWAGAHAGLAFVDPLAFNYVMRILGPEVGLTRFDKHHYRECVGFRLAGFVSVLKNEPKLEYVHVSPGMRTYNVALRKDRAEPCRFKYSWPCHECTIGYEYPEGCRLATHPFTHAQKFCSSCDSASWFDSEVDDEVCLVCREKATRKGERYVAGAKSKPGGAALV
jgi:hypothetical protein